MVNMVYKFNMDELNEIEARFIISILFFKHMGYKLDIDNPRTFNEKIQWYKLYYRNNLMTICSDKFKMREYVKEKIGCI